jgi:hypothetical protein
MSGGVDDAPADGILVSQPSQPGPKQHLMVGEAVTEQPDVLDLVEVDPVAGHRAIEQFRVPDFPSCARKEGKRGRTRRGIGAHGDRASEPLDRGADPPGFPELVPVHRKRIRQKARLVEPLSDDERLPGPLRGRGKSFLGQQRAERDPERCSGLAEKRKGCSVDESVGGASLKPGDERPQLVDGVDGPARLPCHIRQAQHGIGELHHPGKRRVVCLGHAKDMDRDAEAVGDVPERCDVTDDPPPRLDHRDVGLVVTEQQGELLLAEHVQSPICPEDHREVPGLQGTARLGARPQPQRRGSSGVRRSHGLRGHGTERVCCSRRGSLIHVAMDRR